MDQQGITKIASVLIGLLVAVLVLFFGFNIVKDRFSRAEDLNAQGMTVGSITQNSASINFTTGREATCFAKYGTQPTATALTFFSQEDQPATTHEIPVTLLSPETTYHFCVECGDVETCCGGATCQFTTAGAGGGATTTGGVVPTRSVVVPTARPTPTTAVVPTPTSIADTECCEDWETKEGCTAIKWARCVKSLSE